MGIYYPLLEVFNTLSDRLAVDDPAYLWNVARIPRAVHGDEWLFLGFGGYVPPS